MKTITEMLAEHKQKLQEIRDRKGSTAELVDQMAANSAKLIAAVEGDKKATAEMLARREHAALIVSAELSEIVERVTRRKMNETLSQ